LVSLVTAYRDLVRLREIYVVLVRHGFGEVASRLGLARARKPPRERDSTKESEPPPSAGSEGLEATADEIAQGEDEKNRISVGERIRLVAQDLGPSFVKLGQIASTRTDVLPADVIMELKKLQDAVPPVPWSEVKRQVETSLARPIDEVYASFDEKPLAAASIGQVHRAMLRVDGGTKDVVVKVQRPGVAQTIARDLELLHGLAKLVERTIPESKLYSPVALVENFDRSITAELDYTLEADNARRFEKNFSGNKRVRFPHVHREASTRQVLTLEYLPGKKVYDAIAAGHSGPEIAKLATGIVIKQVFEDGFFHADPHPGNILILGEPGETVFGMIDLGMVGRLSPDLRDKTIDLMIAAVREDTLGVADALYAIGTPTRKVDMRAYRAEAAMLAEKYLGKNLAELELSKMLRDLVGGATKYGIEIPPDFLMVGKTLMTLEGVGKEIDPDLDVFQEAKPYFVELLKKRYSPERMMNELWRVAERMSGAAYDMPQQVRDVLEDLRLGRLKLQTESVEAPAAFDRLGRRIFSGLVVASGVLGGAMLSSNPHHTRLGYVILGLAGIALLLHVARDVRRP
jgi:ubiquinone biosynthesis protein